MRFVESIETAAVLVAMLTVTEFAHQHSRPVDGDCGAPVAGIALCLSRAAETGEATLEIRNAGPRDAVLNLGIMLANGASQYPTAIALALTDSQGKQHHGELIKPEFVAGRLDPFIVPLPSGASLRLSLHISDYALYTSGHLESLPAAPGEHYTIQAQLTGKRVSPAEANLDVKGIALMPYWTGAVVSNTLEIGAK